MPKEPAVDIARLQNLGFTVEFCAGIRTAKDVFDRLRDLRDAVAHFLIDGERGDVPLNCFIQGEV